jgi:hypothetical protein
LIQLLMDMPFRDEEIHKLNAEGGFASAGASIARGIFAIRDRADHALRPRRCAGQCVRAGILASARRGRRFRLREQEDKQTMFRAPAAVFRGEPSRTAPAKTTRVRRKIGVERRTESLRAGYPFEARLDEDFLQTHRIARQEA